MNGVVVRPGNETLGRMPERMLLAADSNEDIAGVESALSGKSDRDKEVAKDGTAGPDPETEEVKAGAALVWMSDAMLSMAEMAEDICADGKTVCVVEELAI